MNEVRRSQKNASHRIASILEDAEFIAQVSNVYPYPLVPNRRAGLWYVPPDQRRAEAYFKSTDGHINEWQFSLKRLNLHLVKLIEESRGAIVVDTTRRGKRMPDALAKTVPIWCAVLNKALLGIDLLQFPKQCVSSSEQDRIRAKIPEFVAAFCRTVSQDKFPHLSRPLRPVFITPNEMLPDETVNEVFTDAYPVICATASRQAQDGEVVDNGYAYVQGAADDHELWAPPQFSPEMLWHPENCGLRELGIGEEELQRRIRTAHVPPPTEQGPIMVTPHIFMGTKAKPHPDLVSPIVIDLTRGEWQLSEGKRGVKQLGKCLPAISDYFESRAPDNKILIIGPGGTDFANGVALMLDCRFFDTKGSRLAKPEIFVTKEVVTQRNVSIISRTGSPPSRATQNVVGSFLRSKHTKPPAIPDHRNCDG